MYDIAFVLKGKVRKSILGNIEKPKTAKTLSKELNKHIQSVSRSLIALEKKKLIQCLNPKDDRFRFYKITHKGTEVIDRIKQL